MIQTSELLNLVFDSIGLGVIIALYRERIIARYTLLFLGFFFVWLSNVCTVLEGFTFPDPLNFLEHFFYAASGLLFFIGFLKYFVRPREDRR